MTQTSFTAATSGKQFHQMSPAFLKLLDQLKVDAPTSSRVLVLGSDANGLLGQLGVLGYTQLTTTTADTVNCPDNSIDVAILSDVQDDAAALKKIAPVLRRVLRPGGRAVFVVEDGAKLPDNFFGRELGVSEDRLRLLLGRYLDILSITEAPDGIHFPGKLLVNCQKVARTAGLWDLVTRQRKF